MAYTGVYTNNQGVTYTFKQNDTNRNTYTFGSSAGADYTFSLNGIGAENASYITTYTGNINEFNDFIAGNQGNFLEVDGIRSYFQPDPNLVNAPLAGTTPSAPHDYGTTGSGSTGSSGTGVSGGGTGGTFGSILDAINSALGQIGSTSPQQAALNAQAQSLGNASYNLMTQLQGQIQSLLGQSGASSANALNNLTSQMNALGTGKQSLLDTTIARMNQLATSSKRKKIDTEATKVAPTTSLFGL